MIWRVDGCRHAWAFSVHMFMQLWAVDCGRGAAASEPVEGTTEKGKGQGKGGGGVSVIVSRISEYINFNL